MDVVWLKRDARLTDHGPLAHVTVRPFVILYVYEPDQLQHHSVHGSHVEFVNEGLQDLDQCIASLIDAESSTNGHCVTFRYHDHSRVVAS